MMSVEPDRSPAPQMAAGLQPSADRTGELYRRMETILRAAEKGPRAAMARAINSRWFDLEPAALVENVLVATGLDFEAATSLVELAEEEAELTLSPAAYAATMRLGEAEEKHVEMLALLARARGLGVEPSAGMLRLSPKSHLVPNRREKPAIGACACANKRDVWPSQKLQHQCCA